MIDRDVAESMLDRLARDHHPRAFPAAYRLLAAAAYRQRLFVPSLSRWIKDGAQILSVPSVSIGFLLDMRTDARSDHHRHVTFDVRCEEHLARGRFEDEIRIASDALEDAGFDATPLRLIQEQEIVVLQTDVHPVGNLPIAQQLLGSRIVTECAEDQLAPGWKFDRFARVGSDFARVSLKQPLRRPDDPQASEASGPPSAEG